MYVDSSALVKRYRTESGPEQLENLLNHLEADERIIVSRMTHVEVAAAITRRARSSFQLTNVLPEVLEVLNNDMKHFFEVVDIGETIMAGAVGLAQLHGLRGADAVQLACARFARSQLLDQAIQFVACDRELNEAAVQEGFAVWDPAAK